MRTRRVLWAAVVLLAAGGVLAADNFEEALVVKVEKGPYGPRGMPGDIVQHGYNFVSIEGGS